MAAQSTVLLCWTLEAPGGAGDGPIFDLDTIGIPPSDIKTIQAGGGFDGQVVVMISQDGLNFDPLDGATFQAQGALVVSLPVNARYWKVRRFGQATSAGSSCVVQIGAAFGNPAGGGGSTSGQGARIITGSTAATATDLFLYCALAGPSTVTLPAPADIGPGKTYVFQDIAANLSTQNLTISPLGGALIEGQATFVQKASGAVFTVTFDGSSWRVAWLKTWQPATPTLRNITASTSALPTDEIIKYDLAAAATLTLPAPATTPTLAPGYSLLLTGKLNGPVTLTLQPTGGALIDGAANYVINTDGEVDQVFWDGVEWHVIIIAPQGGDTNARTVTANDTLNPTDTQLYVNLAAAATLTLPPVAGFSPGFSVVIRDIGGNLNTAALTIMPTGGALVEGLASYVMASPYAVIILSYDGTMWRVVWSKTYQPGTSTGRNLNVGSTVLLTDTTLFFALTAAATLNLPDPATTYGLRAGFSFLVRDSAGNFATFPLTLMPLGGVLVEGAGTYPINANRALVLVTYDGVQWRVSQLIPAQTGDARTITASGAVVPSDSLLYINLAAAATLTLPAPAAVQPGFTFTLRDVAGNLTTFPLTLTPTGGALIEGNASYVVSSSYAVVTVSWNGTGWRVVWLKTWEPGTNTAQTINGAYTLKVTDEILDYTIASPFTLTLPAPTAVRAGQSVLIRDVLGTFATNNLTIQPTGGATIEGQPTAVINTAFACLLMWLDGTDWKFIAFLTVYPGNQTAITMTANTTFRPPISTILCQLGAAATLNLPDPLAVVPTGVRTGYRVLIRDAAGNFDVANLTINAAPNNIEGAATYTVRNRGAAIAIVWNGTQWQITHYTVARIPFSVPAGNNNDFIAPVAVPVFPGAALSAVGAFYGPATGGEILNNIQTTARAPAAANITFEAYRSNLFLSTAAPFGPAVTSLLSAGSQGPSAAPSARPTLAAGDYVVLLTQDNFVQTLDGYVEILIPSA